jgi:hypothetical protein
MGRFGQYFEPCMSNDQFREGSQAFLQLCLERDRLLSSPEFARSPVMAKLLHYLVNHALAGNTDPVKSYTIAVEALGRPESFDAQADSYPRVQVGRLRKMIDNYYLRHPSDTRISIPVGEHRIELHGYPDKVAQPAIGLRAGEGPWPSAAPLMDAGVKDDNAAAPTPPVAPGSMVAGGRKYLWLAVAILLGGILAAYMLFRGAAAATPVQYPRVAIVTVDDRSENPAITQQTAAFLQKTLYRFEYLDVSVEQQGANVGSDYRLLAQVTQTSRPRINLRLERTRDSKVIWSDIITVPEDADLVGKDLSAAVIKIAGHSGAIWRDQSERYRGDFSAGFPCLVQADIFLRNRDMAHAQMIVQCMKETSKAFVGDSYLAERQSFLRAALRTESRLALPNASAYALPPPVDLSDRSTAYGAFAEARNAFFDGNCERGKEWANRAIERNPLDTYLIGYSATYLTGCGDPLAEQLAEAAIRLDPEVDASVYTVLSYIKYRRGDFKEAYRLASYQFAGTQRSEAGLEVMQVLSSLALGDKARAQSVWNRVAGRLALPAESSPERLLAKFIADPKLRKTVAAEFARYDFP